jgi:hypothetical protein
MSYQTKKARLGVAIAGGLFLLSVPADASISAELAKKCRAQAIQAHPTQLYGASGTATQQREYFSTCVAHNGNAPDDKTTGSVSGVDR